MRYSDQTISDCNILPSRQISGSLFDLFNHTQTADGAKVLETLFTEKLESIKLITERQSVIKYFSAHLKEFGFPIHHSEIAYIQEYLRMNFVREERSIPVFLKLRFKFSDDPSSGFIRSNVLRLLTFIRQLKKYIPSVDPEAPAFVNDLLQVIRQTVDSPGILKLTESGMQDASPATIIKAHNYLRIQHSESVNRMLDALFIIDAMVAIAITIRNHGLVFPELSEGGQMSITDGYHLFLKLPVKNTFNVDSGVSLVFMTGANMAGKSTFLRSISAIVCLAHSGLAVPAAAASVPYFDVVEVLISGGDNLSRGYSKFYNEILVIKQLFDNMNAGKKCFSVFDEVFSGTNLNDAVECASITSRKLAGFPESLVMISSHNIQLTGPEQMPHVQYNFIEALIEGGKPVFTFKIRSGINEIALGLHLFKKMEINP